MNMTINLNDDVLVRLTPEDDPRIPSISLFSGAMGLDLGMGSGRHRCGAR